MTEWETRIEEKMDRHMEVVSKGFTENQKDYGKIYSVVTANKTNIENLKESVDRRFSTIRWVVGGIWVAILGVMAWIGNQLRGS